MGKVSPYTCQYLTKASGFVFFSSFTLFIESYAFPIPLSYKERIQRMKKNMMTLVIMLLVSVFKFYCFFTSQQYQLPQLSNWNMVSQKMEYYPIS